MHSLSLKKNYVAYITRESIKVWNLGSKGDGKYFVTLFLSIKTSLCWRIFSVACRLEDRECLVLKLFQETILNVYIVRKSSLETIVTLE